MEAFQALVAGISIVYLFWPLVILGPLLQRKNPYPLMKSGWTTMAIIWLLARFATVPPIAFLIPEPLNSTLFFLTGILLFQKDPLRKNRERSYIRSRGNSASSPRDLLALSPTEFENMAVELFSALGHKAKRTGAIGDHGVDVIVQAKNGEKWVVQCKRWRGSVGEPVIRDFYGVMHHEKADRGMIITTGTFTSKAREWTKGKPIDLLEGDEFLKHWKKAYSPEKSY